MTKLISQKGALVTPDTADALRRLQIEAAKIQGLRVHFEGVPAPETSWDSVRGNPGPTGLPPSLSMRPTGREVYLHATLDGVEDPLHCLSVLWGLAVPLGFVPWRRYPVPSEDAMVFHYLGPWESLVDFLHGEGRGEWAWPSLCAAAQSDVGKWEGAQKSEIALQSQLSRLGIHCGPVDGLIGDTTLSALRSLGMGALPLTQACESLESLSRPPATPSQETQGIFSLGGRKVEGFTSGKVYMNRTKSGWSLTARGPGRYIFVVGE